MKFDTLNLSVGTKSVCARWIVFTVEFKSLKKLSRILKIISNFKENFEVYVTFPGLYLINITVSPLTGHASSMVKPLKSLGYYYMRDLSAMLYLCERNIFFITVPEVRLSLYIKRQNINL